jgi:predicted  nucleic acid-binding Zn-ribbon protein
MDNYQCQNCSTLIQSSSTPTTSGCPDASFHKWTKLAPVGDTNYQCKKCGTLVKASRTPTTSGCPQASFHQWTKL